MKKRRIIFIVVICVFVIGTILWVRRLVKIVETIPSENEGYSYQTVPTDIYIISGLEGNASIKLPPSAIEIYDYESGFREIFTMVRFTMEPKDLEVFMASTLCTQPLAEINHPEERFGGEPDWWIPNQAQQSQGCEGESESTVQHVIIDMSSKDKYIVYVSASTK